LRGDDHAWSFVITAAFIGCLIARVAGATAAALEIFLPVYLVVVPLAPSYKRRAKNRR
jgi:chromate transport protein ChrA